jgi:hypothetical protein
MEQLLSLVPRFRAQGERIQLLVAQSQAAVGRLSVAFATRPDSKIREILAGNDTVKQQMLVEHTKELVDAIDRLADLLDRHNKGVSIVLDEIETICRTAKETMG